MNFEYYHIEILAVIYLFFISATVNTGNFKSHLVYRFTPMVIGAVLSIDVAIRMGFMFRV